MADKDKRLKFSRQYRIMISKSCGLSLVALTPPMNRKKTYVFFAAVFFGCLLTPLKAQVNLKAGYNISFLSDPGMNEVIQTFEDQQDYSSDYDKFSWLHGFETGLRVKSGVSAFEITYQNGYQRLRAKGDLNGGTMPFTDEIKISVQSAGIGYYASGEIFGMGTDVQYQWYRTKVELADPVIKFRDIQEMWAMKFYCVLTLRGSGGIDAALQPYFILPFGKYDHDPLSLFLNQETGPAAKKWNRFGLSFLFYNGDK